MEPIQGDIQENSLIPLEAFLFFPSENEIIRKGSKYSRRAIFEGNIRYSEAEERAISEFNQEIKKAGVSLGDEYLQACSFKVKPTIAAVQEFTKWRKTRLPVTLTSKMQDYLERGILYAFGRDHRFRPILILNAYMIDPKLLDFDLFIDMTTYLLEYILDKLLLPGQVESWVVIVDLGSRGITDLPLSSIKTVFSYLQNNYRARMHKSYVINAPTSIFWTWKVIKSFLDESTAEKISISKENVDQEIFLHVNSQQLEERFGGKAKNLKSFWPPTPCPESVSITGEDISTRLVSQEQYLKLYQEGKLKGHKINQELISVKKKEENTNTNPTSDTNT